MKKLLSVLCVFALVFTCLLAFPVHAETNAEGDYEYYISHGEATIFGYAGAGGDIIIPSTLENYPVTAIDVSAFEDCSSLTSVSIPESVTSIGLFAFFGCTNLNGIWVDSNNANYSSDASGVFFNKAKTILIQAPAKLSGSYAVPEGVTAIEQSAFRWCSSLTSVTLPEGVKSIGNSAFEECTYLKSVTIPASLTSIGGSVFENSKPTLKIHKDNQYAIDYAMENYLIYITGPYSVVFKDYDGRVLSTNTYYFGDEVTVPESPTRAEDGSYSYRFVGWDSEVVPCNGDKVYTAVYQEIGKTLTTVKATLYGHDDVKLTWNAVENADQYSVYIKAPGAKSYKFVKRVTTTTYSFSNLNDNAKYCFRVAPFFKKGDALVKGTAKSISFYTARNLSAPRKVTAKLYGYDDVIVRWGKVKYAAEYRIYCRKSTSSTFRYKGRTTSTSFKCANLHDGYTYVFKVVPCSKVNGEFFRDESYATAKATTLKKVSTPAVKKYSSGKVKISWDNISGERGYQISRASTKERINIVSIYNTTSGGSKTITSSRGSVRYYRVRAFAVVDGKRIYGPWSAPKAFNLK